MINLDIKFLSPAGALDAGLEFSDVYSHPAYGRSAEYVDFGVCEIAADIGTGISFTYIKRFINDTDEYDIVTPYGYGGLSNPQGCDRSALKFFRSAYLESSIGRGLIAEFLRLSPLDGDNDVVSEGVDKVEFRTTFGSHVSDPAVEFGRTSTAHRGAVRKAIKNEVTVEEIDAAELVNPEGEFRRLYMESMERLNARSGLRMPQGYYRALLELPEGAVRLVHAVSESSVVAGAIFLLWGDRVHYHLSSANDVGRRLQATDLLLDFAVREFGGLPKTLHVGGGVEEGDGLEKFKRRATSAEFRMQLCSNVVNPARYSVLSEGFDGTSFFPAYRGSRNS